MNKSTLARRVCRHQLALLIPICLGLPLLLSGCTALHSDYQRPVVSLPEHWQQQTTADGDSARQNALWWQAFADPTLDQLITQVLARNNDLAVAGIKLRKARLQADLTATNRTPDLAVSASSQSSRPLSSGGNSTQSHTVEASVSYELDLWGRLASSRDAARWEAEATAQDKAATELSLIGTTAQLYWQIAYLHQSLTLGEASLQDTRRALELAQLKHQAGATDGLDLLQAEQDLATQEANLTQTRQQLTAQRLPVGPQRDAGPQMDAVQGLDRRVQVIGVVDLGDGLLGPHDDLVDQADERLVTVIDARLQHTHGVFDTTHQLAGVAATAAIVAMPRHTLQQQRPQRLEPGLRRHPGLQPQALAEPVVTHRGIPQQRPQRYRVEPVQPRRDFIERIHPHPSPLSTHCKADTVPSPVA